MLTSHTALLCGGVDGDVLIIMPQWRRSSRLSPLQNISGRVFVVQCLTSHGVRTCCVANGVETVNYFKILSFLNELFDVQS